MRADRATPEGTRAYIEEVRMRGVVLAPDVFRSFGRTGLEVSKVGYGAYRVHAEVEEHVQTLLSALLHGINVVDTSTNYTDGGSERLVGNVLHALIESNGIRRENVVIVSKVGYAQGSNYEVALQHEAQGDPFPEMVKYQTGLWHCIHPEWLKDQLARSLERLQLDHLDVLLLHNPEYYFTSARESGGDADLDQLRAVFHERVTESFEQMERFVADDLVSWYGVSSNTFAVAPDTWEHVSLSTLLECARTAAERVHGDGDLHHCAVAELPVNLYEGAAFAEDSGPDGRSFLEVAQGAKVAVLTNRPLNAIAGAEVVRLAQYEHREEDEDPPRAIGDVAACEGEIITQLQSWDQWETLRESSPTRLFFDVGEALAGVFPDLTSRDQWLQAYEHFVGPSVAQYVRHVDDNVPGEHADEWQALRDVYRRSMAELAATLTSHFNLRETEAKAPLREALSEELGAEVDGLTLSQIALNAVASLPGVTTALCGMKRETYVQEGTRLLATPGFADPYAAFRASARESLSE